MIEKRVITSNAKGTIHYLEKGKSNREDNQIRELFDINGNKIDYKQGWDISDKFKNFDHTIYSPASNNLTDKELHSMAKDIIKARSQVEGKDLQAIYSIHRNKDGTNPHIHLLTMDEEKQLDRHYPKGRDWMNKLDAIEFEYTKDEKEREKVIELNQKRMDAVNKKYERGNYTNTQKVDNFILKHMNKETGYLGLKRVEWAINKSKMSDKQKEYYKKRISQRLRGLESKGIVQNIDGKNFKIYIEKYAQEREKLIENGKKNSTLELARNQLYKSLKEIKQEQSSLYKDNQKHFKNLKNLKGVKGLDIDRQDRSLKIQMNFQKIEELRKIETKTKIDIIDSTLLTRGEMDPDKAMLKAMTQKYVSLDAIRKNTMLQVQRLEQLKSKGLVTKDGSTYKLAVSREEFLKYKDSPEAAKHMDKLTEKILPSSFSKTVKGYGKEVDRWVNKWTKTSTHSPSVWTKPLATAEKFSQEVKKSYWSFKPRSSEERFLAFGLSVALATTKFTLKFATKIAWKTMKETGKAIYQTQKDIKTIHSNHKIISKMQKNQSIGKLARDIKTQERKIDKNYEYKVKPKSKQQEVKNERTR